jgi:hypothetical protein
MVLGGHRFPEHSPAPLSGTAVPAIGKVELRSGGVLGDLLRCRRCFGALKDIVPLWLARQKKVSGAVIRVEKLR